MSSVAKWVLRIAIVLIAVVASLFVTDFLRPQHSYSEPNVEEIVGGIYVADTVSKVHDKVEGVFEELAQPFYALIMGGDTRINTRDGEPAEPPYNPGRSDTMMLARIDPIEHDIALITVPRDTPVYIDERTKKINSVLDEHGPEASIDIVEELTGARAKYYYLTDFSRFSKFIDAVGGVDVNVPFNMGLRDILNGGRINLEAGEQHLDGKSALVFSRIRKNYLEHEEACRQIQDRQVVRNVITNACASEADAALYLAAFLTNVETNMNPAVLEYYVKDFVANNDSITFRSGTGPYVGGADNDYGPWMVYPDDEAWKKVMQVVDEGGDPTTVVGLPEIIQEF